MPPDQVSSDLREIGSLASWSVSSSKPGFGVEHLSDPDINTLWQSEGPQPHLINIHFAKKQQLKQISIYADVSADDSYTPQKISFRAGTHHADLAEVSHVELVQPMGWQHFRLGGERAPDGTEGEPIKAHLLQIAILTNHLNGKDTHIRGLRVFAPREPEMVDGLIPFTTTEFLQHDTIR